MKIKCFISNIKQFIMKIKLDKLRLQSFLKGKKGYLSL